ISTEPEFFLEANDSKRGWKSPHNVILGHLYTGGVLGLLVFAGLVVVMCRVSISQYLREMREKKRASFITLFTGLVICFGLTASLINFSHYLIGVYIHWLVFWLPFTLVWFLEVQQRKECA
ncbi:MAG TPA: hypothetical protein VFS88_05395, partial [Micavibrio sp.]|nr:hypothetical protein [Micavibrio sp.]